MSLQACANLVARADPDRFAAVMAAPLSVRSVMLPIYAANVEIARAPWVTKEAVIAEMRLQWWRDVLEEVDQGRARKHEIVDELSKVLTPGGSLAMDAAILARRWDIYKDGFDTVDDLLAHVGNITFGPMFAVFSALNGDPNQQNNLRSHAVALGLARFLRAIPDLISRNVPVWVGEEKQFIYRDLCDQALAEVQYLPKNAALIETAGSIATLKFVRRHPGAVEIGKIPDMPVKTALSRAKVAFNCPGPAGS